MTPLETVHSYRELTGEEKAWIVAAHSAHLDGEDAQGKMTRIFHLGNPDVMLGSDGKRLYCRIYASGVPIMKLLMGSYQGGAELPKGNLYIER